MTKLEQINDDGTPKDPEARWSIKLPALKIFSLSDYIKALFMAERGYFRLIVFIVTSQPFVQSDDVITRPEAINWLHAGLNILPEQIAKQVYSEEHHVTALIYEFEKIRGANQGKILTPGRLSANTHLKKTGVFPED